MGPWLWCLGSVLAAFIGLSALAVGARTERGRFIWLLLAAIFLISAGFGAAETIYQLGGESEDVGRSQATRVSAALAHPTLEPSPTQEPLVVPSVTATIPSVTPRSTSIPRPTTTVRPSPTASPDLAPTAAPAQPSASAYAQADALASALIPSERDVLAELASAPRYLLDAVVDFENLTVDGTADILFTNNEIDTVDAIYLRLYPNADHYAEGETRIETVDVDGVAVEHTFEDSEGTILKVPLPASLDPGDQTELQIAFDVVIPRRADRFGYDDGVMSLGHWYPMLAVYDDEGWNLDPYVALGDAFYSDVANYTVNLTLPEDVLVAATGIAAERQLQRADRVTTVHLSGATRDFALALSRDYETVSTQVGDTTVTSYYLPGHSGGGQQALQVASDALEVFNSRFGRYPYTELDIAETSFRVFGSPGGMEFPGIVFIGSDFYKPDGLFGTELDVVVAHEVAHQWWYGVVGNNQVDEPWLDEAFATFASLVYFEDKRDVLAAETALWTQAVLPYQLAQMMDVDGPLQSSLLDYEGDLITYDAIIYSKGALFLVRLREILGDDLFFELLQRHYQTYKYGLLNPGDFRRSIEELGAASAAGSVKVGQALALYDAVVLNGEAITGIARMDLLEEVLGSAQSKLSPEQLNDVMQLLGPLLDGEMSSEELLDMIEGLGALLGDDVSSEELGSMLGLFGSLLDGELSSADFEDMLGMLGPLLENLQP
jgi:hypothetical protein